MTGMHLTKSAAILGVLAFLACGCRTEVDCTAEARLSLRVRVVDPAGRPVCGATVVARDRSFAAAIPEDGGTGCAHSGIPEREGTYDIEVRRGEQRAALEEVEVSADACHVQPRSVTVTLPG
jgi:hypothetical protein